LVRSIFKRLHQREVQAKTVTSMTSTPHTLLFVDMNRQPIGEYDGTKFKSVTWTWTCRRSAGTSGKSNGQTIEADRARMTSRVFRRVERLELCNAAARRVTSIPIRVLLIHAEGGLTGVLPLDGANTTTSIPAPRRKRRPCARIWRVTRGRDRYFPAQN
jgi:hypothetical protein